MPLLSHVQCILYALPAWGGYLPASLVSRIDAFLRKAVRFVYASQIQQLADLLSDADEQLFTKMEASNHCLYQLLPPIKSIPMQLRTLNAYMSFHAICHYNLYKRSFVLRYLFLCAY